MELTVTAYYATLIPQFSAGSYCPLQQLAVKADELLQGKGHDISGEG